MDGEIEVLEPAFKEDRGAVIDVDGHKITPAQWRCFELWIENSNMVEVHKRLVVEGYTVTNSIVYHWKRQLWWGKLCDEFFGGAQNDFRTRIASKVEKIAEGLEGVATGDEKYHKSANAVVQLGRLFGEMGDHPLIQKRPMFSNTTNIQNNTLNLTSDQLADKLRGLNQQQLIDFNRTGRLPEIAEK